MKSSVFCCLSLLIASSISGCSILPFKTEIKENHFRFENFRQEDGTKRESIRLLCYKQSPSAWFEPRQYIAGEHVLWVKASTKKQAVVNSTREAYVKFVVDLLPNKSYMLNRKVVEDDISIWVQDVSSGEVVSKVEVSQLKRPLLMEELRVKQMCESSTI